MKFEAGTFYGYLINGDLSEALAYAGQFPDQADRMKQYATLFERGITLGLDQKLEDIFADYQSYYRNLFWLGANGDEAEELLRQHLTDRLGVAADTELDAMEDRELPELFRNQGFHFMGGRTGGRRGPYIWQHSEERTYAVELPEGVQEYTVRFHSGFLTKSWLDYLSLGEISPGGWTNGDGMISCIKDCYDENSQRFQVSLLKHEAQHVRDLAVCPDMSQEELEYRAKLVELIYWDSDELVQEFAAQAGDGSGHALAARRIAEEFSGITGAPQVQCRAWELFAKSCQELKHGE